MVAKNKRKVFSVNITNKLGERMKSARESRGYTREQLSERSGVSERYIVAIENEGSVPKIPVLNDLLRGLGLSANFIFYPEQDIDDPQLDHLIRLFYACDVRDCKVIIDVANSLIDNREPQN